MPDPVVAVRRLASSGLAWVALVLALLAGQGAAQPRLDHGTQLQADVYATQEPQVLEFNVTFAVAKRGAAYVKVSPIPGNPVFGNGTSGKSGWWTEVTLTEPLDRRVMGNATGDEPIELGEFEEAVLHLVGIRVHVPAGPLAIEASINLDYILAVHSTTNHTGSGGYLDESVPLHLTINVLPNFATSQYDSRPIANLGLPALAGILCLSAFKFDLRRH